MKLKIKTYTFTVVDFFVWSFTYSFFNKYWALTMPGAVVRAGNTALAKHRGLPPMYLSVGEGGVWDRQILNK